jgi:prepilin-type N-terminal cleavage/methylation domain-containing protein
MKRIGRARPAFTIIEVLVALTIGAFIMIGVRILVEEIFAAAEHAARDARTADTDANGERLLRRLAASAETGTMIGGTFGGDSLSAHFVSWCDRPGGWQRRCRVALGIEENGELLALRVSLSTGERLIVARASTRMSLLYLSDASNGGSWMRQWGDSPSIPVALGLVRDTDTLIIRLGDQQ